jgi:5-carboxymethyl-2-hydroxymuconate isomerase
MNDAAICTARIAYGRAAVDGRVLPIRIEGGAAMVAARTSDRVLAADVCAASTDAPAREDEGIPVPPGSWLAPVTPSKVIGIGLNYADHAREAGTTPPESPQVFAKFPSSLAPPIAEVALASAETDYEVELAVVIGRRCRNVRTELAMEVIAGFAVANDLSARDRQRQDGQVVLAKSYDGYCPLGPAVVPVDEIANVMDLRLWTSVNGRVRQDSRTAEMLQGVRDLVSYCSRGVTLEAGDVIITGTPAGVGFTRTPPEFLTDGDVVEVGVEAIGRLVTTMRARA